MSTHTTRRACSFLDKGGTGKTTSIAHLSVALADAGESVLAIDLAGKQGDLTKHFGLWQQVREEIDANADDDWPNIATVFEDRWAAIVDRLGSEVIDEMIYETTESVDLIPAHPSLDSVDNKLALIDTPKRYMLFDQFLTDHIDPRDEYSVILIDLPGLTNNVTYNGLWAAGNVIAPVEMGTFESEQAAALRDDIKLFGDRFDRDLQLVMVLPNKLDTRTKLDKAYLETFTEEYPDAIAEPVPRSQDIRNAAEAGRTLFASKESSKTAQRAREAYQVNGEELLRRIGATVPTGGEVDG